MGGGGTLTGCLKCCTSQGYSLGIISYLCNRSDQLFINYLKHEQSCLGNNNPAGWQSSEDVCREIQTHLCLNVKANMFKKRSSPTCSYLRWPSGVLHERSPTYMRSGNNFRKSNYKAFPAVHLLHERVAKRGIKHLFTGAFWQTEMVSVCMDVQWFKPLRDLTGGWRGSVFGGDSNTSQTFNKSAQLTSGPKVQLINRRQVIKTAHKASTGSSRLLRSHWAQYASVSRIKWSVFISLPTLKQVRSLCADIIWSPKWEKR